jgi:hypothetical protein
MKILTRDAVRFISGLPVCMAPYNPLPQGDDTMQDDERCCGTGTCIINAQGLCWCGQRWDGEKMCRPALGTPVESGIPAAEPAPDAADPT